MRERLKLSFDVWVFFGFWVILRKLRGGRMFIFIRIIRLKSICIIDVFTFFFGFLLVWS